VTWDGWGIAGATIAAVFVAGIVAWAFRIDRGIVRLNHVFDEVNRLRADTEKDIDVLKEDNDKQHEALWIQTNANSRDIAACGKDIAALNARRRRT